MSAWAGRRQKRPPCRPPPQPEHPPRVPGRRGRPVGKPPPAPTPPRRRTPRLPPQNPPRPRCARWRWARHRPPSPSRPSRTCRPRLPPQSRAQCGGRPEGTAPRVPRVPQPPSRRRPSPDRGARCGGGLSTARRYRAAPPAPSVSARLYAADVCQDSFSLSKTWFYMEKETAYAFFSASYPMTIQAALATSDPSCGRPENKTRL